MTIKTVSLKIPKGLHEKLMLQVINDGYGMRGKSKWVKEAVEELFAINFYPELVDVADDMGDLTTTLSIRLPTELYNKIDDAIVEVRGLYPKLEGVKSKIVRASILQRLLKHCPTVGN